ncbi:hypothetical protein UGMREWDR_CDS0159 [Aeromonas phage GomatiRiver_11]|nr:hypothetical protein UGMREWDR_CDS0159 [Aeromonas phage GomatiRiver_11]
MVYLNFKTLFGGFFRFCSFIFQNCMYKFKITRHNSLIKCKQAL